MYPGHWASFPGCSWADLALQRWYLHGSEFKYPISSILSWEKELNGICSLSVVTYNVILCHCNSPGTPGAADILCAGDWASDWSCLHSSQRRSCPTRTQGAGLTVYPLIPSGFRKKKTFCLFSILWSNPSSDSSLTLILLGDPAGQLLRSTHCGIGGPGL